MFYDTERNTLLLRLYAKSRAIGHVPGFEEINQMTDMPTANTFALHCGSYANAVNTVESLLLSQKPLFPRKISKETQEEMDIQDKRVKQGWIPIQPYTPRKSLRELLDEVMGMTSLEGTLPREFSISFELNERLKEICQLGTMT